MKTNTSDLVRQMNIVSEEHEQVLRELKNMQSVVGYISHLLDAYNIMSTRVDELEEEIKELKRGKNNKTDTPTEGTKTHRVEKTVMPNMRIIMGIKKQQE